MTDHPREYPPQTSALAAVPAAEHAGTLPEAPTSARAPARFWSTTPDAGRPHLAAGRAAPRWAEDRALGRVSAWSLTTARPLENRGGG